MREFSLTLDARPTEVTAIAIAIAFHQGLRRMGRHEDFPSFVKSAANILAPVHWDLGHVDEHYFPIRDFRASADLVAPTMATSMATSPERRSPARAITTAAAVSDTATGPSIVGARVSTTCQSALSSPPVVVDLALRIWIHWLPGHGPWGSGSGLNLWEVAMTTTTSTMSRGSAELVGR
jgi:hypothetical protein